MTDSNLRIVLPDLALEQAYARMLADYAAAAETIKLEKLSPPKGDFHAYVAHLAEISRGVNLPPLFVPTTTYWLIEDGAAGMEIVGTARLRRQLNEPLRDYGGHIGYDIRPSSRNRGYATRLLALMLEAARGIKLTHVLLTCDADNIASRKVIEKNGGVLDSEGFSARAETIRRRYWIRL